MFYYVSRFILRITTAIIIAIDGIMHLDLIGKFKWNNIQKLD